MSERDLDLLYKRASAQDGARPSTAVRQAVLEHARRLAEQAQAEPSGAAETPPRPLEREPARRTSPSALARWFARWPRLRWQIAAPLAAAALAVILLQPLLRSSLPAPAKLRESAPPAATADRSAPLPPVIMNMPQPPLTAQERSAPEPFPAANAPPQRQASRAAAPPPAPFAVPTAPPAAQAPSATVANAAKLASNSDVAASGPAASAARIQSRPLAAPAAEPQERPEAQSAETAAAARSPSELLRRAAAGGDLERVGSLLQLNAVRLDARDASGRTALMLAVLHDHEAVVRALLQRGADPNIADAAGRTPLAVARRQNQTPMVEALLQAGAH